MTATGINSSRAPSADHLGRSEKDFAIEFAEYLARDVEAFLDFLNASGIGAYAEDQDGLTDHWRGLQSAIYEFRKRKQCAELASDAHK